MVLVTAFVTSSPMLKHFYLPWMGDKDLGSTEAKR